jgi:hypothetical protein
LRHYFATCAIESGLDVPTVARWLGHKDGGALLMKIYSHLQQAHSVEQMKRVSFTVATETPGEKEADRKSIVDSIYKDRQDRADKSFPEC